MPRSSLCPFDTVLFCLMENSRDTAKVNQLLDKLARCCPRLFFSPASKIDDIFILSFSRWCFRTFFSSRSLGRILFIYQNSKTVGSKKKSLTINIETNLCSYTDFPTVKIEKIWQKLQSFFHNSWLNVDFLFTLGEFSTFRNSTTLWLMYHPQNNLTHGKAFSIDYSVSCFFFS